MQDDKMHDKCGIVGVVKTLENPDYTVNEIAVLSLYAMQHRGQESAGISFLRGEEFCEVKNYGLANELFSSPMSKEDTLACIGHVRYSTSGSKALSEVQPFLCEVGGKELSIAHNGNIVNSEALRDELLSKGHKFFSSSDSEVIPRLMDEYISQGNTLIKSIQITAKRLEGAYSLVILTPDFLFAIRDPNGIRPLSLAQSPNAIVFASETCAFEMYNATFVYDVKPNEIVSVNLHTKEIDRTPLLSEGKEKFCIFEYIYFARPDSNLNGESVYWVRKQLGKLLAEYKPCEADIVVPVPDSGIPSAMGFADASGIPFELGIIRSHYTGRTFISPTQKMRENLVRLKHSINKSVIEGKRVVLIDDSIVRGTTSKKVVRMLKEAGAKEIHLRIASPPTKFPCLYGIDTPSKEELIINRFNESPEEIAQYLGADSIGYLPVELLAKSLSKSLGFCDACFTGKYFHNI